MADNTRNRNYIQRLVKNLVFF